MLHNNNCNKAIKQQSLNFDENQAEQETESQITRYKGALYSKLLFYVVHSHCDPGFFMICFISDAYTLMFTMPHLV